MTVLQVSVPVATPALAQPIRMGLPHEVDDVSVQLGGGVVDAHPCVQLEAGASLSAPFAPPVQELVGSNRPTPQLTHPTKTDGPWHDIVLLPQEKYFTDGEHPAG